MEMTNEEALNTIYNNVMNGKIYGYDFMNVKYPFFHESLYLTADGYIGWTYYGSSAIEPTKKQLDWLIRVIFELTPKEFLETYITFEESAISEY